MLRSYPRPPRSALVGFYVESEPTVRAPRIVRDQLVDDDSPIGERRDTLRDAEMDRAHRVGIGKCGRLERTRPQHHLDALGAPADLGVEALALHRVRDDADGILVLVRTEPTRTDRPPADLDRGVACPQYLGEQEAEALVGPGHTPAARRGRVDPVHEPWTSAAARGGLVLVHEAGVERCWRIALWLRPRWEVSSATSTGRSASATYRKISWRVGSPRARACSWSGAAVVVMATSS